MKYILVLRFFTFSSFVFVGYGVRGNFTREDDIVTRTFENSTDYTATSDLDVKTTSEQMTTVVKTTAFDTSSGNSDITHDDDMITETFEQSTHYKATTDLDAKMLELKTTSEQLKTVVKTTAFDTSSGNNNIAHTDVIVTTTVEQSTNSKAKTNLDSKTVKPTRASRLSTIGVTPAAFHPIAPSSQTPTDSSGNIPVETNLVTTVTTVLFATVCGLTTIIGCVRYRRKRNKEGAASTKIIKLCNCVCCCQNVKCLNFTQQLRDAHQSIQRGTTAEMKMRHLIENSNQIYVRDGHLEERENNSMGILDSPPPYKMPKTFSPTYGLPEGWTKHSSLYYESD